MRGNHTDVTRPSRSHSQLSQWLKCGTAYELTRNRGVPELPGIYLAGGSAVHSTIQRGLLHMIGA